MAASSKPTARVHFSELNDLASNMYGSKIIFSTDDWFAVAENLTKPTEPEWRENVFTDYGKWMDGWESRRRRSPGHDWCIIQLGIPGIVYGVDIDTCHFTGNNVPRASVQAACLSEDFPARSQPSMGTAATKDEFEQIAKLESEDWTDIVPVVKLGSGYAKSRHNLHPVSNPQRWTHIRLNAFPDGGIARLRIYGIARPDWSLVRPSQVIDLGAMVNGGSCIGFSDSHYGHARNIIAPGRAARMDEGWETARRLDRPSVLTVNEHGVLQVPGFEWAAFRLGHVGVISKIEVDTNHFKGNYADSCRIEACLMSEGEEEVALKEVKQDHWRELLPPVKLAAHERFNYEKEVKNLGPVSHVRVELKPDGGISRVRLWGHIVDATRAKL